jgi:transposase-like protein
MAGSKKRHPAAFKAKVALEAAKQTKTATELAKAYQVHPVQISQWKKHLLDHIETLFRDGRRRERGPAKVSRASKGVKGQQRCQERMALPLAVLEVTSSRRRPARRGLARAVWSAGGAAWAGA